MKWLLRIVLFFVALIFLIGAFLFFTGKSYTYNDEVSIEVDAPIDYSYEYFMDEGNMSKWMKSKMMTYDRSELVKGEENTVGSEYDLYYKQGGGDKEIVIREVITDIVENQQFGMDMEDIYFKFHTDVQFTETANGKTKISQVSTGTAKNVFMNGMQKLMEKKSHEMSQEWYDNLKALIEESYQNKDAEVPA